MSNIKELEKLIKDLSNQNSKEYNRIKELAEQKVSDQLAKAAAKYNDKYFVIIDIKNQVTYVHVKNIDNPVLQYQEKKDDYNSLANAINNPVVKITMDEYIISHGSIYNPYADLKFKKDKTINVTLPNFSYRFQYYKEITKDQYLEAVNGYTNTYFNISKFVKEIKKDIRNE